jgi:CII-binding regulator of phage lambda lysogenization HflD
MDLLCRLKEVISYSKLSDRAFALKCGLKQPTLDKQLKGLRAISLETIIAVCAHFPEFSRDWLLMGEGDMLKSQSKEVERLNRLVETISTLQETINTRSDTIAMLSERIKQLENQIK